VPDRSPFNRLVRFHAEDIEEIALHLIRTLSELGDSHTWCVGAAFLK
jgi:hypothetical protein